MVFGRDGSRGTPGIAESHDKTASGSPALTAAMPHANILAGFLVLGLLAFFYLFSFGKADFESVPIGWISLFLPAFGHFFLALRVDCRHWRDIRVHCLGIFADRENRGKLRLLGLFSCFWFLLGALTCCWLGYFRPGRIFSATEGPVSDR